MGMAQVPRQVRSAAEEAVTELKQLSHDKRWTRSLAAGTLVTGAVLLVSGRRKSGIAATVAGAALALLEEPEEVAALWNRIPGYLQTGQQLLSRFENFVQELAAQGDTIRTLLARVER